MSSRYITLLILVAAAIAAYNKAEDSEQGEDATESSGISSNLKPIENLATRRETARNVGVKLPNGNELSVILRPRPWQKIENPQSLAGAYDELSNRAATGDVVAAISLSKLLRRCDEQPYTTPSQLQDAMAQLRSEGSVPFRVQGVIIEQPTDPALEDSLTQTFEFCRGVSAERRAQHQDWLRLAADMGDPLAQVTLAHDYPIGKPEAKEYLLRAWESGSIDAAGWLARMYRHDSFESDLVKSYAWLYVYSALVQADFENRDLKNDPAEIEWMAADERTLRRGESELDPGELAAANEMANEILSSNTACCFSRDH